MIIALSNNNKNNDDDIDLVSVVEMHSLGVKHDFPFPFEKPNPCSRNVTRFCIPEKA